MEIKDDFDRKVQALLEHNHIKPAEDITYVMLYAMILFFLAFGSGAIYEYVLTR